MYNFRVYTTFSHGFFKKNLKFLKNFLFYENIGYFLRVLTEYSQNDFKESHQRHINQLIDYQNKNAPSFKSCYVNFSIKL